MNNYVPHPFREPWTISGHFTFPNIFPCGYRSHKQIARDFVPEKFRTTTVYLIFIFYLNASVFTQPCLVAVESWSGGHQSLPWAPLTDHDSVSTRNQISETKTGTAFREASTSYDTRTATVPKDHQFPLLWALRMNADQLLPLPAATHPWDEAEPMEKPNGALTPWARRKRFPRKISTLLFRIHECTVLHTQ